MSAVDLSEQEWGQVMSLLAEAPWKHSNPLLMKIGEQLRANALAKANPSPVAEMSDEEMNRIVRETNAEINALKPNSGARP